MPVQDWLYKNDYTITVQWHLTTTVQEYQEDGGISTTTVQECQEDGGISTTTVEECQEDGGISTTAVQECQEDGGITTAPPTCSGPFISTWK
jgi:hypothetical protein